MMIVKKMQGEKIFLGPVSKKHIPNLVKWMNDLDVVKYTCQASRMHTEETTRQYLKKVMKEGTIHYYGIFSQDGELVGGIDLRDVDNVQRSASIGIVIGEKEYWNKGYGTEAINLLLDYGFNVLNLNNIMLTVFDFNVRAFHVYEKIGFKIIGKRRKSRFFGGKYYDEIYMDMLSNEYKSNRKEVN